MSNIIPPKSNSLLTVGIPVYNFGEFLPSTLDSILDQAVAEKVEVLVLDGGSTDDTRDIAKLYATKYHNFRYVRVLEKGGIDVDMARTVELAETPYIWLFSGDDLMLPGALGTILQAITRWTPDLLLSRHNECHFDMTVVKEWPVLSITEDRLFDLNDSQDRRDYLGAALTSEAFFSFMGGMVVNRLTWFKGKLKPSFKGSNWAHIGRLWELTEAPFRLGYIHQVLQNRRGENDSFSKDGMLARLEIQIRGLIGIFEDIYGESSTEIAHMKRVIQSEVEPHWANAVRDDLIKKGADTKQFEKLDSMLAQLHS